MRSGSIGFLVGGLLLAMGGCGPVDDVPVQPLPPLDRPSAERRAGLPEVAGAWHFAGWELAPGDSAALAQSADLPRPGELLLQTQRLDSVAGVYAFPGGRMPLTGEVRRDSVVSLVALAGPDGRFLVGRLSRDTLWVALTTLVAQDAWPYAAQIAYVRTPVVAPFARLKGALPPVAAVDSAALAAADSAAAALRSDTLGGTPPPAAAPSGPPAQPLPQPPAGGQPAPARPPVTQPPAPARPPSTGGQPQPAPSRPATPRPDSVRSEPAPAPRPAAPRTDSARPPQPPPPVPLLGEPVRPTPPDTGGQ